jgi:putative transposase
LVEDLNLKGLIKRNKPKQDEQGNYLPNHQSQKAGMNKSFCDAGVGQFLDILSDKAENAGKKVIRVNPNYTSQICCYCNAHVPKTLSDRIHTCDCGLEIDRDWNASLNIKRVGLDVFPTIKRPKGKDKGIRIIPNGTSTLKEILELPRSSHHTKVDVSTSRNLGKSSFRSSLLPLRD